MWDIVKNSAALHTGVFSVVSFAGTGTNDLTISGTGAFATTRQYKVEIDGTETYKWSNDNGATWEATTQPIYTGLIVDLIDANGDKEGVSIRFASRTGHVAADAWTFSTTGQVVPNTDTKLGANQCAHSCDSIIIKGEYSKGTETGIDFYFVCPRTINGSVLYRPSRPTDTGAGLLLHYPEVFELTSSASFSFVFEPMGNPYYQVWAVKKGGTVSGLFTLFHEQHRKVK